MALQKRTKAMLTMHCVLYKVKAWALANVCSTQSLFIGSRVLLTKIQNSYKHGVAFVVNDIKVWLQVMCIINNY